LQYAGGSCSTRVDWGVKPGCWVDKWRWLMVVMMAQVMVVEGCVIDRD
jgi:hypothetical protein